MIKKKKQNPSGTTRHLVITALAGAAFWLVGEGIYAHTTASWFTPLAIAFWFVLFAAVIGVVLIILSHNNADFNDQSNKKNRKENFMHGLICLLVLAVLAGVFEYLYELGRQTIPDPTSYIFLIDDSGSMDGTEQDRTDAITSIMEHNTSNLPYAVYMFTDDAELIKPMGSYRSGDANQIRFQSNGGTAILGSLSTVLSDLQSGTITGGGANPRVLILSDGASGRAGLKSICRQAVDQGVSVSTVGMRGSGAGLLKRIAGLTGGVFVPCSDASALGETMETAITSNAERNLLSERVVFKNDLLYGILRVAFLALLGVVWSLYKGRFLWEPTKSGGNPLFPPMSIPLCALGALLLELLSAAGVSLGLLRLIFCVLWAVTPGHSDRPGSVRFTAPEIDIPEPEPPKDKPDAFIIKETISKTSDNDVGTKSITDTGSGFGTNTGSGSGFGTNSGSGSGFGTNSGSGSGFGTNTGSGSGLGTNSGSGSSLGTNSGFGIGDQRNPFKGN